MKHLVSVIVPIYKVEDDLEKCVESIINQSYKNLEIILVDDGSPDRCGEIADYFAQNDSRIKVIHKKNGGLSDARNVGLNFSTGDYLTFVDSDDYLDTSFVERLLSLSIKYCAEIVVCKNLFFSKLENALKITRTEETEKFFSSHEAIETMLYQRDFDVAAWGKLYKAYTHQTVRFPKGLIHEDISTTYKTFLNSNRIVFTSEELYYYQVRENSIENEKFTKKKMNCITTAQMMLDDIGKNHPELLGAARSRYIAANLHILAQIHENVPEKAVIKNNIIKVRKIVLKDKKATVRVRGACALTYLSFDLTTLLLNFMKKRSS